MMKLNRRALLVATLSLVTSPVLTAQPLVLGTHTQCVTRSIPASATGWAEDVIIDKFDPDLGLLTGVSFTTTGTLEGTASIESTSLNPGFLLATFSAVIRIFRPGEIIPITQLTPSEQFDFSAAAFDGTVDFDGPSGMTFSGISVSELSSHTSPAPLSDLDLFTGVSGGVPGTIVLPVTATGTSTATGVGNLVVQIQQTAALIIEVCYTYDPHVVSDSDSTALIPTNWTDSVTLDRFDPDLGILTDVIITLTGTMTTQAQVESLDALPGSFSLSVGTSIVVDRPGGGSILLVATPQVDFLEYLTGFDGAVDFGGSSGVTFPGVNQVDVDTVTAPPRVSDLALFTGTPGPGHAGTITLPVSANSAFNSSGPGNISLLLQLSASAAVDIEYHFDLDCNQNGVDDNIDLQAGSLDRNANGIPDECEVLPSFCNGDGGDGMGCTDCPCGNNATPGTTGGCLNSALRSARLEASGDASVSLPAGSTIDLRFSITDAPPLAFCILNSGDAIAPGDMANPCFGLNSGAQAAAFDGLRCAIVNTRRHGGRSADLNGEVGITNNPWGGEGGPLAGLAVAGAGFVAGQTRFWQVINRDDPLASCMRGLNTSQAIQITFAP